MPKPKSVIEDLEAHAETARRAIQSVMGEQTVTIQATKPAEGGRRIVLAIVDDAGHVKMTDWEMNAQAFRHLPERYSWEQHFYPAIVKLMQ